MNQEGWSGDFLFLFHLDQPYFSRHVTPPLVVVEGILSSSISDSNEPLLHCEKEKKMKKKKNKQTRKKKIREDLTRQPRPLLPQLIYPQLVGPWLKFFPPLGAYAVQRKTNRGRRHGVLLCPKLHEHPLISNNVSCLGRRGGGFFFFSSSCVSSWDGLGSFVRCLLDAQIASRCFCAAYLLYIWT